MLRSISSCSPAEPFPYFRLVERSMHCLTAIRLRDAVYERSLAVLVALHCSESSGMSRRERGGWLIARGRAARRVRQRNRVTGGETFLFSVFLFFFFFSVTQRNSAFSTFVRCFYSARNEKRTRYEKDCPRHCRRLRKPRVNQSDLSSCREQVGDSVVVRQTRITQQRACDNESTIVTAQSLTTTAISRRKRKKIIEMSFR